MGTLKLASSLVEDIAPFHCGHLQIVFEEGGSLQEIEVQAPSLLFAGWWTYPEIRGHTDPESTSICPGTAPMRQFRLDG